MNDKKILHSDNTVNKNFNYSKGECSLKFTLRVDIKQELKDFLECLNAAIVDVKKELEIISKK